MGGVSSIGSIKGRLSPIGSLIGTLSVPIGSMADCDIYEGDYTVRPDSESIVLATANKLLKNDIVIEAASDIVPEGSEIATDGDIGGLIDDVFGEGSTPNPDNPVFDSDDIATEDEVNDIITDIFG